MVTGNSLSKIEMGRGMDACTVNYVKSQSSVGHHIHPQQASLSKTRTHEKLSPVDVMLNKGVKSSLLL